MFKIISRSIGVRIEKVFKENDMWQQSFSDVRLKLNECMRICQKWKETMLELTSIMWRENTIKHKWEGKPYSDSYIESMVRRMHEIFELRS